MVRLSVNINKVATLRNSRGKNQPDVVKTALDLVDFGAHGITVHPRPDGRHIRRADVYALKEVLPVELNVEGYPTPDFLKMVIEVKPAQCTLVPDPPEALTSSAGWDIVQHKTFLTEVCVALREGGVRSSVFLDPNDFTSHSIDILRAINTDRVELYTEAYAEAYGSEKGAAVLSQYSEAGQKLWAAGIAINAGHDLNLKNLSTFVRALPWTSEVSIGHALVCDALCLGWERTMAAYLACLK